jgi:hypothetical protein
MTVDQFLDLLHLHLTLLESGSWPGPHSASAGPALYLDSVETRSLIAELAKLTGPRRLAQAGHVAESPVSRVRAAVDRLVPVPIDAGVSRPGPLKHPSDGVA